MEIKKLICVSLSACFASAGMAQAQSTLSYGAYVDYDYDTETEEDETTVGTYLEYEFAIGVFAGVEIYSEDSDDDDYGYDLSIGYRGAADGFGYQIAYYDYNLEETGDDGEEVVVSFDYAATETLVLSSSLSSDLDGNYELGQDFGWALPAAFGLDVGFDLASDSDDVDWYTEVSRSLTDSISLTAGVEGTSEADDDPSLYLSVAFDGSISPAF